MNEKAPTRKRGLNLELGGRDYTSKRISKKKRVLIALCEKPYHRFRAETELNDHCLHSTVSTIQNQHGIQVEREWVTVPGFQGIPTRVCCYWIADKNIKTALKTAKFWR